MGLTSKVNKFLDSISKYYEGVSCYVRSKYKLGKCDELLPKEFCEGFERVDCISLRDLINGDVVRDELLVRNDRLDVLIHVNRNAKVCILEVSAREVILDVDECVRVDEGDLVAYLITGKGEVRGFQSRCKGYIVLIEELVGGPQTYKIYVVGDEYVREVRQ